MTHSDFDLTKFAGSMRYLLFEMLANVFDPLRAYATKPGSGWRSELQPYITDTHLIHSSLANIDQTEQDCMETEEDIISIYRVDSIRVPL